MNSNNTFELLNQEVPFKNDHMMISFSANTTVLKQDLEFPHHWCWCWRLRPSGFSCWVAGYWFHVFQRNIWLSSSRIKDFF